MLSALFDVAEDVAEVLLGKDHPLTEVLDEIDDVLEEEEKEDDWFEF